MGYEHAMHLNAKVAAGTTVQQVADAFKPLIRSALMIEVRKSRRGRLYEALVGDRSDSRVFWYEPNNGFGLKWRCESDGRYYSQWLMWSCRAGQKSYYPALRALYRALRRDGVVEKGSLRKLAK